MNQLFLTSIIMSFIMMAFLFHRRFKGTVFSSKVYYFVWIIIAIRLILPFDMSIKNPVYQLSSLIQTPVYKDNQLPPTEANINNTINNSPFWIENKASPTPTLKNNNLSILTLLQENIFNIWLAGALIYLLYNLLLYGLFQKRINKSLVPTETLFKERLSDLKTEMGIHKDLQLRKSDLIDSPMITGLIRPVLLLPPNIGFENIDVIFRHELIHLKRNDIAYKGIIFMATAIHWFNPLVHLMLKIAGQDLELSCDEEVVRRMSKKEKTVYCKTLINSISTKKVPLYTSNFSGGKKIMKQRIDAILDSANKKISKSFILFLILCIFATSLLIGCEPSKNQETQADILYQYKTPYIGDNSKVGNILSNLDFPEGYSYESMVLLTDAEPYKLQVNCIIDNMSVFPRGKFEFLSAMIFSLIDNLDAIQYIPKDDTNYSKTAYIINRKELDSITLSIIGMHTKEIGDDKDKFQELVGLYENYDPLQPEAIDTSHLHPTPHENINDFKDVTMAVKEDSIQKTGLSLLFENQSKKNFLYSDDFMLEQKIDGMWYESPITIDGDYGFHDIAYKLPPKDYLAFAKEIREFTVDWEWLYGVLEPGEYRIIKAFTYFRDAKDGRDADDSDSYHLTGDFDSYYLAAEFKIQF